MLVSTTFAKLKTHYYQVKSQPELVSSFFFRWTFTEIPSKDLNLDILYRTNNSEHVQLYELQDLQDAVLSEQQRISQI